MYDFTFHFISYLSSIVIKVNKAVVTGVDRTAQNGVIHFVDDMVVVPHVDFNLEGSANVNLVAVNILALLIALVMIL
jgi:hypothetical protein